MFSPGLYFLCNQTDLQFHYTGRTDHQPVVCELCRRKHHNSVLHEYPLPSFAVWYYCPVCGFSGTGLDYLAAVDNTARLKKLKELVREQKIAGVTPEMIRKFADYLDGTEYLRNAYKNASPFRRSESYALAPYYDLDYYPPAKSFRNGSRQEFERWFRRNLKRGKHNTSGSRVFHGHNWARITAIPLYDLPFRMSGVLFINGHENAASGYAIKRLGPVSGKQYAFEPGYLGTRTICSPNAPSVILVSDWRAALRLQAEYYKQEQKSAALLGWFPADPLTRKPQPYRWTYLEHIPKVFWATINDLYSLREACLQTAQISYSEYPMNFPQGFAGIFLREIIKDAVPWHKALTCYLDSDITKAEKRIEHLNLPARIIDLYLTKAPAGVRDKIGAKHFGTGISAARFIDGDMIESNPGGWWRLAGKTDTNRVLLSNVRCSLDKVIHLAGQETMLQGRIFVADKEYSFTETETAFERNPIRLIKQTCIEQGCEHFLDIGIKQDKFLRITKAVSKPKVVHIRNGFGWSVYDNALALPNITISDSLAIDTELSLASGPFYPLTVKHTEAITTLQQTSLANFKEESPFILAILASLIPVVFAPAYRMSVPQTVVTGGDIAFLQQIFRMLGLPQFPMSAEAEIERYETIHKCPYLVRADTQGGARKRNVSCWADAVGFYGPAYGAAPLFTALSRMSYGNANLLLLPGHRFYRWFEGKLPDIFLKCFTLCLRHFSRYVLNPKPCSDNWNNDLIQEAVRFFETDLGLPVSKKTVYDGYYDASSYFSDYVNLLKRSEKLTFDQNATECRISVIALSDCYRQHIGQFDLERIQGVLTRSDLLKNYDTKTHTFILDAEMINLGARRLEQFYGSMIRSR